MWKVIVALVVLAKKGVRIQDVLAAGCPLGSTYND
jgi:hypothetical protein